ncbi:MAG TPA: SCO family protein [Rhizomicrobium sp.]|jgi:protein SCO1/2|nr:SCO family protein [Rhizomicrobium sp.]
MKRTAILALALLLTACGRGEESAGTTNISGAMPALQFDMTRANDGAGVTAADYRGKAVALYFGYTHCPDECPATLANFAAVMRQLGPRAKDVRVLFVTVDPRRDTLPALKQYVNAFAPQIDGLRGTPDETSKLARRYRVLYSVAPAPAGEEVMHSDAVFFFDPEGYARLVTTETDNTKAIANDLGSLLR